MDKDFAYLLGAAGDAAITYRKKKGEYCIEYEQKDRRWLQNSIVPRILRAFRKSVSVKRRKSGLFRARLYSKAAFGQFHKHKKNPSLVLGAGGEAKRCFVRGFFDAEGSAPARKGGTQYRIQMYQKDRRVLRVISKILGSLGIRTGKITNSYDVGQLPIRTKENVRKFSRIISCEHPGKSKALEKLCS